MHVARVLIPILIFMQSFGVCAAYAEEARELPSLKINVERKDYSDWVAEAQKITDEENKEEQSQFDFDYNVIRKSYPDDLRKQYQMLLYREYLGLLLESEKKYSMVGGKHERLAVADVIRKSGTFPGLARRADEDEAFVQKTDTINFLYEYFQIVTFASVALETLQAKLLRDFAEEEKKIARLNQDNPWVKRRKQALQLKVLSHYGLVNDILSMEPTLLLLLGQVSSDGKSLKLSEVSEMSDPQNSLFSKIANQYHEAHLKGGTIEDVVRTIALDNAPLLSVAAGEFVGTHKTAAESATEVVDGSSDASLFMIHQGVRSRVLHKLNQSQFWNLDFQIATEQGIASVPSTGQSEAGSQQPPQDRLGEPHRGSLFVYGNIIAAGLGTVRPLSTPLALGVFTVDTIKAWRDTRKLQNVRSAVSFGAYTGLNSYEIAREMASKRALRVFAAGMFFGFFFATITKRLGLRPFWGTEKVFDFSNFIVAGGNVGSSLVVLVTLDTFFRGEMGWALFKDPGFQVNFCQALIIDSILGFYSVTAASYFRSMIQVGMVAGGVSIVSQKIVNALDDLAYTSQRQDLSRNEKLKADAEIVWNTPVDWDRVFFDYTYVALFSFWKARKMFRPRYDSWSARIKARFPDKSEEELFWRDFGAAFTVMLGSNLVGTAVHTPVTRTLMEEDEFKKAINDILGSEKRFH